MAQEKIDYASLKKEFKTQDEAIEFLKGYVHSLRLSYVPHSVAEDIKSDAIAGVSFGILLEEIPLYTADIRIEADKYVGKNLLRYQEYKVKE
jgi:hypothetical protein